MIAAAILLPLTRERVGACRVWLAVVNGALPRAQQEYERRAGVEMEAQFGVGMGETTVFRPETIGQRGRLTFTPPGVRGQQRQPA